MYCPTCGSEERQLSQYCRACGTDLRSVRITLERPDAITASAVSAREQISRTVAEKIRQMESSHDLKRVAEDVLPQIEKFLESPEEKRLRRIRTGVVTASIGLGGTLMILLISLSEHDFLPFVGVGLVAFFIGIGILINGLAFTVPRKELADKSNDALAQEFLDSQTKNTPGIILSSASSEPTTNQLGSGDRAAVLPSVTEHTTHQLKPDRS
jgi:hypothetical protein